MHNKDNLLVTKINSMVSVIFCLFYVKPFVYWCLQSMKIDRIIVYWVVKGRTNHPYLSFLCINTPKKRSQMNTYQSSLLKTFI